MAKHLALGADGERRAADFLSDKGYLVIGSNYRRVFGEVDLIAKSPDGILVFVEVKTLGIKEGKGLVPEDHMTASKILKLRRICEGFAWLHSELWSEGRGWRLDLVAISVSEDGKYEIAHYENV